MLYYVLIYWQLRLFNLRLKLIWSSKTIGSAVIYTNSYSEVKHSLAYHDKDRHVRRSFLQRQEFHVSSFGKGVNDDTKIAQKEGVEGI